MNKFEEKIISEWRGYAVVDDSFEDAGISLNADRIADWWIDKLRSVLAQQREEIIKEAFRAGYDCGNDLQINYNYFNEEAQEVYNDRITNLITAKAEE